MRVPAAFVEGHIAGAVNLQFNRADLAERAAMVLPKERPYLMVAEPDVIARTGAEILSAAGYDVGGFLEGGMAAWTAEGLPTEALPAVTVDELQNRTTQLVVIDVRESYEFNYVRIPGATNHPSTQAWATLGSLPDGPLAIVCADETRSAFIASAAASIGRDARLVRGGMTSWLARGFPTEGRAASS